MKKLWEKFLAWLAGLFGGGGAVTTRPTYRYFDAADCVGAGCVNNWLNIDPDAHAEAIAAAGLDCLHIEFYPWGSLRRPLADIKGPFKALLKACRKRNVVLFTCIFNDNFHTAKYGNTPWRPTVDPLLAALDFVTAQGPEAQIVQPVGETQTAVGKQFEAMARDKLARAGILSCFNGNGGHPSSRPAGWQFAAVHPSRDDSCTPGWAVCVTDHGAFLQNELGGLSGWHAGKVESVARNLKSYKRPAVFYGFLNPTTDSLCLDAIKRGWGR